MSRQDGLRSIYVLRVANLMTTLPPEFETQPNSQSDSGGYSPETNDIVDGSEEQLPEDTISATPQLEERVTDVDAFEAMDEGQEFEDQAAKFEQPVHEIEV